MSHQIRDLIAISEGHKTRHQQILESFSDESFKKIYLEWYQIGSVLTEAPLTQAQVQDIFKAIEQGAMAGGNVDAGAEPGATASNRTLIGKGADFTAKIAKAWDNAKTKIAQSGPVSGFDVAVDKLQTSILNAAGGQKGVVGQAIQKYRDFATKYPKTQGAIYAILAVLAGISGWGLGGAAIVAGIRTADRLLQGDRASSALWKGFKAGAISYGAGQLASHLQGAGGGDTGASGLPDTPPNVAEPSAAASSVAEPATTAYKVAGGDTLSDIAQRTKTSVEQLMQANPDITHADKIKVGQVINIPQATGQSIYQHGVGTAADTAAKVKAGIYKENINYSKIRRVWQIQESFNLPQISKTYLTDVGIQNIFRECEKQIMISEGIWDSIKGAAKAGWKTATNKITYEKLDTWWRRNYKDNKAEGDVDSEEVINFLRKMGVKDGLINSVFADLKIPTGPTGPEDTPAKPGSTEPAPATGPTGPDGKPAPGTEPGPSGPTPAPGPSGPTPAPGPGAEPKPGQEVELPGTSYKFKYSPQWMTDDGKIASDASAKVLSQLASGVKNSDLDTRDVMASRRQPWKGSAGMTENKKRKLR